MTEDFERIGATPEQRQQLEPLYRRFLTDFYAIQRDASARLDASLKRLYDDLCEQVSPDQGDVMKALVEERLRQRQIKKTSNLRKETQP